MMITKKAKNRYKENYPKVKGYFRVGSTYVSLVFVISVLAAIFALGITYMTALHPTVAALWYERQALPDFSIYSPYLAGYTGKARLFGSDNLLVYEGDVVGAVVSGNGKLYQNGLLLYDGGFQDNMYNGSGILYAPDGSVTYSGDFAENLPQGSGTLYFTRGGEIYSYTGAFEAGAQSGEGVLFKGDVLIYEGGFKDNMRDGYGREYIDGRLRYEGTFLRDVYDGEGKLFDKEGRLLYEGGFASGKYGGDGTEYNPDTGHPIFQGKYLDGGRMEAGTEFDENGVPITEPTLDSDPLDLMDSTYADALAVLSSNSAVCREQALDGLRMIIDESGGVLYAFSLNEEGEPESMSEIYLCGLASAGGLVVGSEIGDMPELQSQIPELGAGELFALSLSNTIWGKETSKDELVSVTFESEGRSITAFCEALETVGEASDSPEKFSKNLPGDPPPDTFSKQLPGDPPPDTFSKVLPGDVPGDGFTKEIPGDVSPLNAGRIVFIKVGIPAPAEEALPTED